MGLKKRQLLECFHTLGDDPVLETFAHADDRAYDDGIIRTGNHIVHERLVELQGVNGKSRQVA